MSSVRLALAVSPAAGQRWSALRASYTRKAGHTIGLEHAYGAFAWAVRLLPVPHQRAYQPQTIDGLTGRGRLRALSPLLLLHNASLSEDPSSMRRRPAAPVES